MINKKSINIFIEKVASSSANKAKTAVKEISENKNQAQIYTDAAHIPAETINANYYIQMPAKKKLFLGTKSLKEIAATQKAIEKIKNPKTKELFEILYGRVTNETSKIKKSSTFLRDLIQKIEMIENPETKEVLHTELEKLTRMNKKEFKNNFSEKIIFIEKIADASNILNCKYANIKSEPRELYKWLDKNNSWFTDCIDGKKGTPDNYRNGFIFKKGKMDYDKYSDKFEKFKRYNLPLMQENNIKLEAFRDLAKNYGMENPDAIQKIYQAEYLPKLPSDIQKIFKQINEEYGTIVLTSNPYNNAKDAEYILEEFRLWKKAGKDRAILPQYLDINQLDKYLLQNKCGGVAIASLKQITLEDLLLTDTHHLGEKSSSIIRHEINHLNDRNLLTPKNSIDELKDFLHWNINKLLHKKQWKNELKKAGITEENANYALTNKDELKSVTAESFLNKLSEIFKKQLVKKFNMEKWIFNLEDNKVKEDEIRRILETK